MIRITLQVREARSRTFSYAEVSRHGVRLLSKGRTLLSQSITNTDQHGRHGQCVNRRIQYQEISIADSPSFPQGSSSNL